MKRIFLFSMLIVSSLFINTPDAIGQTNSVANSGVTPPASPTGLYVDTPQTTSSTLVLNWEDNSTDEEGFEITVNYDYVITVPANVKSWPVSGLNPAQSYTFYIHSFKKDGATIVRSSNSSGPVVGKTLKFNPESPTGLTVETSQSTASTLLLRWNDNSTDEQGFEITVNYNTTIIVPPNTTSWTVTGLNPYEDYNFYIHSFKVNGAGTMVRSLGASGPVVGKTLKFNPEPPTGLTIETSQSTASTLLLRWNDNSTDEQGFEITVNYNTTIIVPPNTTSWTVTGLNPYGDYNFYIHSFKVNGTGAMVRSLGASGPVFGRTLKSYPIPPGNLRAGIICGNSVELFWTDSDNEEFYAIEQAYDTPQSFGQVDLRGANSTYFVDTKAQSGRLIYYRIKAINNDGKTFTYSSPLAVTTKQFVPALPPHNLVATDKTLNSISIQWINGTEDQLCKLNARKEVRIWVSEDDGTLTAPTALAATLQPDQYRYTIQGLKSGTKYKISIQSIGFNGDSYKILPIVVATFGPTKSPTNLVSNSGTSIGNNPYIGLTWNDSFDNEDAFGIEVSTDQNYWTLLERTAPNINYFVHMPVDAGVTYYYRVFTVNGYGESGRSNVTSGKVDYTKAPNAPYDLKGKVDGGKAMLTWKDDSSSEEMFEVERSDDGTIFAKTGTTPRNKGMFTDTTVVAGKSYHYQVRAINSKGNSGYTNKVSLTIPNAATSILTEAEVAVFPNPTVNNIVVTLPEAMRNEGGVVTIYDQNNRVMNSTKFAKGEVEKSFNLSAMPQGMYLITISTETTKTSKKVFKN